MFPAQLHFAAGSGNARAVRVLLAHADVNIEATYQADVTPVKVWGGEFGVSFAHSRVGAPGGWKRCL